MKCERPWHLKGQGQVMKELRVRCKGCGERFIVIRFERERTPYLIEKSGG